MITVKLAKNGGVELSDKKSTVVLDGPGINLNGKNYDEPGEYETAGIELIRGENAGLVVWEQLQIAYIFSAAAPTNFEKSQFSSSDVAIFSASIEPLTKANCQPIIDEYDPKVLIVPAKTAVEDALKTGLKLQESNSIKLAISALPEEGRDGYLLV